MSRQIDGRTDEHKVAVVLRLVKMCEGPDAPLAGVWWDDGLPQVRYTLWSAIVTLTWREAEEMTGVYWVPAVQRKPIIRADRIGSSLRLASNF